ncbi:MAG: hypothetical protein P8Y80_09315, partial [Acidobacteriota bacterium]
ADVGFGLNYGQDGWNMVVTLFATYAGRASDLQMWTRKAQINRDKNLRLQYLAGLAFNSDMRTEILESILLFYRFPDNVFTGSPQIIRDLKTQLRYGGRGSGPGEF